MENVNFHQVVEESQYVTELEQIEMSLKVIKHRAKMKLYEKGMIGNVMYITSIEDDIRYLSIAVENSIKQRYKMIKDAE